MGQSTAEVRRDIESTRDEMSGTIDAIADRTSPSRVVRRQRRRMADGFRSVRDRVMGTAEQAAGVTQDAVQGARETTGRVADDVREAPEQARQAVRQQTEGNPLAAGVIAFGAGLLVAYVVPSSATERRVARQVREGVEPVLDELTDAGREVAQDLRSDAEQAVQDVSQTATDSARRVADEARDKAETVREEARDKAETVRDEAS